MQYIYCEEKNHRVAEAVCARNKETGKCETDGSLCWVSRNPPDISDEERKKRSERMKKVNADKLEAKLA